MWKYLTVKQLQNTVLYNDWPYVKSYLINQTLLVIRNYLENVQEINFSELFSITILFPSPNEKQIISLFGCLCVYDLQNINHFFLQNSQCGQIKSFIIYKLEKA